MADTNGNTDQFTGVPMLSPDGTVHQVAHEQVPNAITQGGGQIAARVQDPAGSVHWVPYAQVHDAITKGGGRLVDNGIIPPIQPQSKPAPDDKGLLSGLWDSTVGGLVNFDKSLYDYYSKNPDKTSASAPGIVSNVSQVLQGGPEQLLKDAIADPDHPVHQMVKGLVQSHIQTGKQALQKLSDSLAAVKEGNFDEAQRSLSEAQGLGLGTILPVLGPAAVKSGQDIGAGKTGYGLGEGAGLITSVVAPEVVKKGVSAFKPTTATIAGESIPVRASQESGIANAVEKVSADKPLQRFDIEKTQPGAKRAIGNIATEVKNAAGERVPALDAQSALRKLRSAASKAVDLGDAAEKVRDYARPVFDKLDELTNDDPQKFSDLQKQERAAFRRDDFEGAQRAREAQEAVLTKYADQFDPNALKNARSLWRQAGALDDVHDSLNSKSVTGPTPIKFRPQNVPDPGYISGKNFARQIQALKTDGTLAKAGLTPSHVQALQDLGTLLEKSGTVQQADLIARAAKAVKIAAGGPGSLGTGYLASRVLGHILTDPNAATTALQAMKAAAPVSSGVGITHVFKPETNELEEAGQ
jgi:hypothetical protein